MWSLPPPSIAGVIDDLTVAVTKRNGTPLYPITPAERASVQALYTLYEGNLGRAHPDLGGRLIGDGLKNVIHAAYDMTQKRRRLKHIRAALMVKPDTCPYCGITPASDLDHHLPKGAYRVLAIYPRN